MQPSSLSGVNFQRVQTAKVKYSEYFLEAAFPSSENVSNEVKVVVKNEQRQTHCLDYDIITRRHAGRTHSWSVVAVRWWLGNNEYNVKRSREPSCAWGLLYSTGRLFTSWDLFTVLNIISTNLKVFFCIIFQHCYFLFRVLLGFSYQIRYIYRENILGFLVRDY